MRSLLLLLVLATVWTGGLASIHVEVVQMVHDYGSCGHEGHHPPTTKNPLDDAMRLLSELLSERESLEDLVDFLSAIEYYVDLFIDEIVGSRRVRRQGPPPDTIDLMSCDPPGATVTGTVPDHLMTISDGIKMALEMPELDEDLLGCYAEQLEFLHNSTANGAVAMGNISSLEDSFNDLKSSVSSTLDDMEEALEELNHQIEELEALVDELTGDEDNLSPEELLEQAQNELDDLLAQADQTEAELESITALQEIIANLTATLTARRYRLHRLHRRQAGATMDIIDCTSPTGATVNGDVPTLMLDILDAVDELIADAPPLDTDLLDCYIEQMEAIESAVSDGSVDKGDVSALTDKLNEVADAAAESGLELQEELESLNEAIEQAEETLAAIAADETTATSTSPTTTTTSSTTASTTSSTTTMSSTTSTTLSTTSTTSSTSTGLSTTCIVSRNYCDDCGQAPTSEGEFPYHVGVFPVISGNGYLCSGSLIKKKWMLTAAHCFFDENGNKATSVKVLTGTNDRGSDTTFEAKGFVVHENYTPSSVENDIALVELQDGVDYENDLHTNPICIALEDDIPFGGKALVTGWVGGTALQENPSPDLLQEMTLDVITIEDCDEQGAYLPSNQNMVICAQINANNTCQGESGSPMVAKLCDGRYVQVGIVSYGMGCGRTESITVYTKVSAFKNWIDTNTGSATEC